MKAKPDKLFLSYFDLHSLGITYSREWLKTMARQGTFPSPVAMSANRIAWRASDVHAHIDGLKPKHKPKRKRVKLVD